MIAKMFRASCCLILATCLLIHGPRIVAWIRRHPDDRRIEAIRSALQELAGNVYGIARDAATESAATPAH